MKMFLFVIGLTAGTVLSSAWLLSEPEKADDARDPHERLAVLKQRLDAAVADGIRAGQITRVRLQSELDAVRTTTF